MSVAKITFYLCSYDRDRVIELLEQKSELMKESVLCVSIMIWTGPVKRLKRLKTSPT